MSTTTTCSTRDLRTEPRSGWSGRCRKVISRTSVCRQTNIGCCAGWNALLDDLGLAEKYDVIVCFDNDCEVLQEQTLEVVAGLVYRHKMILAPRVDGLLYPPPAIARFHLDGYEIEETAILGNIFMAIPAELLVDFRWDESLRGVGRRRVNRSLVPRSRWSRRVRA